LGWGQFPLEEMLRLAHPHPASPAAGEGPITRRLSGCTPITTRAANSSLPRMGRGLRLGWGQFPLKKLLRLAHPHPASPAAGEESITRRLSGCTPITTRAANSSLPRMGRGLRLGWGQLPPKRGLQQPLEEMLRLAQCLPLLGAQAFALTDDFGESILKC